MTIAEEIRRLTEDPGANRLAQIADMLQQKLNECCGVELNNRAKPATDVKSPAPTPNPAPEKDK